MTRTLARCQTMIEDGGFAQQVSINAAKLIMLRHDPDLRDVVNQCQLVSADGQSVVWASRLLGDPLPERVAGIDLMFALLRLAERRGWGVYILGARQEVLEIAVQRLRQIHPRLRVVGYRDGYFADADSDEVATTIRASGAEILLVAMSSPRKEQWLGRYGRSANVPFAMGVGGAIDVVAGVRRRAPGWWQRLGIEWLYRLLQEPRRMFRRYLVTNLEFTMLVGLGLAARLLGRTGRDSILGAGT
jgi:N-acetylglucosaminyldiphosphoundecaprenol N-acetyl-beta-D-mannosaminyltransferase